MRRGVVVFASSIGTKARGFESRQSVRFQYFIHYNVVLCVPNLIRIVVARIWVKEMPPKKFNCVECQRPILSEREFQHRTEHFSCQKREWICKYYLPPISKDIKVDHYWRLGAFFRSQVCLFSQTVKKKVFFVLCVLSCSGHIHNLRWNTVGMLDFVTFNSIYIYVSF
jgi:hypothetical protein